ncbi:MAG TPA: BrnA antitoxin family protein [Bryobacteraceae bacterium]|nr:BrnA antitoxin family protein [Bryobacteraceae bacterium]
MILADQTRSITESRLEAIGQTAARRHVFRFFTIRENKGKKYIRPISTKEAETFVDTADLTEYDFSSAKTVRFEFEKKEARVNMRLPEPLLEAVKDSARARGIPYQRFIREALEHAVAVRKH